MSRAAVCFLSVKHSRWTEAHWESKPPTPTVDQITDFSKFSHVEKENSNYSLLNSSLRRTLWQPALNSSNSQHSHVPRMPFDNPADQICVHSSLGFRCRWRERERHRERHNKSKKERESSSLVIEKNQTSFGHMFLSVENNHDGETQLFDFNPEGVKVTDSNNADSFFTLKTAAKAE